ncbi:hypothetical protein [Sporichthya polymorpha]|uniref:hypothetical protein n=1 Tax=Sporichthya polymorpha TaxID=35751 RepID=UPI00035F23A1|nr:hypothetical protein [Sporichthya polymorpha]
MAWKLFRPKPVDPAAKPDKLTLAIRMRRMVAAQQKIDARPGFQRLERRWCEPPTADELDQRIAGLAEGQQQQFADGAALAAALRAAGEAAPAVPASATFRDEPEARWIEARSAGVLLSAVATALPTLASEVVLIAEEAVLVVDPAAGRVTVHGDWPAEVTAALAP